MTSVSISNNDCRLKIEKDDVLGHIVSTYSYKDDKSMLCELSLDDLKALYKELGCYLEAHKQD